MALVSRSFRKLFSVGPSIRGLFKTQNSQTGLLVTDAPSALAVVPLNANYVLRVLEHVRRNTAAVSQIVWNSVSKYVVRNIAIIVGVIRNHPWPVLAATVGVLVFLYRQYSAIIWEKIQALQQENNLILAAQLPAPSADDVPSNTELLQMVRQAEPELDVPGPNNQP
eukprot:TRINITY_DN14605_c0_g1_i1.p3 TRINITY_DN14605_c0_g1~~TRINITY_DN14605_c0_g1_i1.p3  ORF type:complete len:167 (+),score=29.63 TRINITY_DN14605_c0_g1_i1:889-1389(+)